MDVVGASWWPKGGSGARGRAGGSRWEHELPPERKTASSSPEWNGGGRPSGRGWPKFNGQDQLWTRTVRSRKVESPPTACNRSTRRGAAIPPTRTNALGNRCNRYATRRRCIIFAANKPPRTPVQSLCLGEMKRFPPLEQTIPHGAPTTTESLIERDVTRLVRTRSPTMPSGQKFSREVGPTTLKSPSHGTSELTHRV